MQNRGEAEEAAGGRSGDDLEGFSSRQMNTTRRSIVGMYQMLRNAGVKGSNAAMARHIANRLGYTIDHRTNCNSFVLKVLMEEDLETSVSIIVL